MTAKRILSLALLALTGTTLLAQESNDVPKHEFGVVLGGGFTGLPTSIDNVDSKLGFGGHVGFSYTYHFNKNWGLLTGLQAALLNSKLTADELFSTMTTIGTFEYNAPHRYSGKQNVETVTISGTRYTDFEEKHSATYLQIPVMAQFITPVGSNHFYVAAGVKAGFRLADNFKQTGKKAKAETTLGGYVIDGIIATSRAVVDEDLWSRPDVGFESVAGGNPAASEFAYGNETAFKKDGDLKLASFNMTASAELGMRWKLSPSMGLYTGLYVDYGFLNGLPKQKDQSFVGGEGSIMASKYIQSDRVETVPSSNPEIARWGVKPEDFKDPSAVTGTTKLADRLSTLSFGITARLTFGKSATAVKKEKPVRTVTPTVVEQPVQVIPEDINKKMRELSNVLFAFDKFDLNDQAKAILDDIAGWLNRHPELNVEIQGHTDNKGTAEYNQTLSENRAKSVYDYFVSKGVSASRLSYRGYGLTQPIATNDTDEGRQLNRRVDLKIIK